MEYEFRDIAAWAWEAARGRRLEDNSWIDALAIHPESVDLLLRLIDRMLGELTPYDPVRRKIPLLPEPPWEWYQHLGEFAPVSGILRVEWFRAWVLVILPPRRTILDFQFGPRRGEHWSVVSRADVPALKEELLSIGRGELHNELGAIECFTMPAFCDPYCELRVPPLNEALALRRSGAG